MIIASDGLVGIGQQLAVLNVILIVYFSSKGLNYAIGVFMRRDPPKKSIRSEVARLDESKSTGR